MYTLFIYAFPYSQMGNMSAYYASTHSKKGNRLFPFNNDPREYKMVTVFSHVP